MSKKLSAKKLINRITLSAEEKLANKAKYTEVLDRRYFSKLPPQCHIGYGFRSPKGTVIWIVSAFIQEHYISPNGAKGMAIKCGNRVYLNLYDDIVKLFIYAVDKDKILTFIKQNPEKPTKTNEEIQLRLNRVEELLEKTQKQLTRSTSMTITKAEKAKTKPKIKKSTSTIMKKKHSDVV